MRGNWGSHPWSSPNIEAETPRPLGNKLNPLTNTDQSQISLSALQDKQHPELGLPKSGAFLSQSQPRATIMLTASGVRPGKLQSRGNQYRKLFAKATSSVSLPSGLGS